MRQAIIDLIGAERFDLALAVATIGVMLTVILAMAYGMGFWPRLPGHWNDEYYEKDEGKAAGRVGDSVNE